MCDDRCPAGRARLAGLKPELALAARAQLFEKSRLELAGAQLVDEPLQALLDGGPLRPRRGRLELEDGARFGGGRLSRDLCLVGKRR